MKRILAFAVALICMGSQADMPLYNDVLAIVSMCETSRYCAVENVADTGLDHEIWQSRTFREIVADVSNNWTSISNEWPSIRDKYETRIVFGEMAGFTGTDAYLGFLGVIVADAQTNAVSKAMLPSFATAMRSPLGYYVVDNYFKPAVSNLVLQLTSVFSNAPGDRAYYRGVLSGEVKRELDKVRSYGAIELWHGEGW